MKTVGKREGSDYNLSKVPSAREAIFCIASSVHCKRPVDMPPFATATILIVDVTSGLVQFFIAEFVERLCLISRMTSCFPFFCFVSSLRLVSAMYRHADEKRPGTEEYKDRPRIIV